MFIKKSVDKNYFINNGYAIFDTDLNNNKDFNNLIDKINDDLKLKINKSELKKMVAL